MTHHKHHNNEHTGKNTHRSHKNEKKGSQSVIDHHLSHRKQLREQLNEVQTRPGGFKLDAVGILKKHREEVRAQDQLDEFNEDWTKYGGEAIDAAQDAVNKLNFKSSATDHIYAKAALRDAKDNFHKNKSRENDLIEQWRQGIFETYGNDPETREKLLAEGPSMALLEDGIDETTASDTVDELPTLKDTTETHSQPDQENVVDSTETLSKNNQDNDNGLDNTALRERAKDPESYVEPEKVKETLKKHLEERKRIESVLDDLDSAVNGSPSDEIDENDIDQSDEDFDQENGYDDSHEDSPETDVTQEKNRFNTTIDKVREKANISRARKAARESFKAKLNDLGDKISNTRLKAMSFYGRIASRFNRKQNDEDFQNEQIEQYSDGQMSLIFSSKGDHVPIGPKSKHKYGRYFDLDDMAIITTESGDQYGLAKGYIVDKKSGKKYLLGSESIDLTIGKKAKLPIIGKIGVVTHLQLRYKHDQPNSSLADIHSTDPSPFSYFEELASKQE